MPESELAITAAYEHGLSLARAGSYFEAREAFETAWRAASPEERDFFQGLVHAVVVAYQAGRGRPVGAERQREKALRRLAAYAPAHRGLDGERLLGALRRGETELREQLVECETEPPVAIEQQEQPERHEDPA